MLNGLIRSVGAIPITQAYILSEIRKIGQPSLTLVKSVIFLLLLIARSKLVPDFAFTIHFLHLVATSVYTRSVPRYVFWWGLQFASASLMTSLGIWSCQWRELQPINFGGSGGRNKSSQATSGPVSGGANGIPAEEEVGFSRLKGKGRGLDGADVYELVSK